MSAPIPGRSGRPPPPPSRAQELVAKAGVSVYESGHTLFDEPVLVYVARPGAERPDFDIFNHVGQTLGSVRPVSPKPSTFRKRFAGGFRIDDRGNSIVGLSQPGRHGNKRFPVSGIIEGCFTPHLHWNKMSLEVSGLEVGCITGSRAAGLTDMRLSIEDHRSIVVAKMFGFQEDSYFLNLVPSYVLSVEPGLKGPLRYLLPALPPAVAIVRRQQISGGLLG